MAQTVCVIVSASDRRRWGALVGDRRRQRKHVERARIVLASAGCPPVQQVAEAVGVSRPMVWRWQQRFAEAGVDGLVNGETPGNRAILEETERAALRRIRVRFRRAME